jgi:acetoin utilization protein AcuB
MLVKQYMTRHPIMIEPHKGLVEAQKLMTENGLRHLPVVEDGKRLVGMLTRQRLQISPDMLGSLNMWEITRYLSNLTVEKVMVKGDDLKTISPEDTIEDAAYAMSHYKVSSLPVLEEGIVAGIITETDLLIELQNLLGAKEPGWRVTVRVPDRIGEYAKLINPILAKGWGIMAMGSSRAPKHKDKWDVVLKIRRAEKEELVALLAGIAEHEVIDLRETNPH